MVWETHKLNWRPETQKAGLRNVYESYGRGGGRSPCHPVISFFSHKAYTDDGSENLLCNFMVN